MTDIPARIMEEARRCAGEWNLIDAIATALLAAEQRARKEALEEAAAYHDDLAAQHEACQYESDHHDRMAKSHRSDAAAIRALANEKEG